MFIVNNPHHLVQLCDSSSRACNDSSMTSSHRGFTLLEILIALFIFTLVSFILSAALRTIINAESGTEKNAARLRELQRGLLLFSRDIEQAVNRPITNVSQKEEAAFLGTPRSVTFTQGGWANPTGLALHSSLRRTEYVFDGQSFNRVRFDALDQMPESTSKTKQILTGITQVQFQYLDKKGRFHDYWPAEDQKSEPLPRAVKISIVLMSWGRMSQLYVIPAQASQNTSTTPSTTPKP